METGPPRISDSSAAFKAYRAHRRLAEARLWAVPGAYTVIDRLLSFLANTRFGSAISERNQEQFHLRYELQSRIRTEVAQQSGAFTQTLTDLLEGFVFLVRHDANKAEDSFHRALAVRSPYVRSLGRNKGFFLCGAELNRVFGDITSLVGESPGFYILEPAQAEVYREVVAALEHSPFPSLPLRGPPMRRIVLTAESKLPTGEQCALVSAQRAEEVAMRVIEAEAWIQTYLQTIPRTLYDGNKLDVLVAGASVPLTAEGARGLQALKSVYTRSDAIFRDGSLENYLIDEEKWGANHPSGGVVPVDFECMLYRVPAGHAFMDFLAKTNASFPTDVQQLRRHWYERNGFKITDERRWEEYARGRRILSQFATRFPTNRMHVLNYLSELVDSPLATGPDSDVAFLNYHGAQLERAVR